MLIPYSNETSSTYSTAQCIAGEPSLYAGYQDAFMFWTGVALVTGVVWEQ